MMSGYPTFGVLAGRVAINEMPSRSNHRDMPRILSADAVAEADF
jgi:hypothetical protein